jgi:hypothetical protein
MKSQLSILRARVNTLRLLRKILRIVKIKFDHPDLLFIEHYDEWNKKRFQFIMSLLKCNSIENLKVLELSAGHANIGKFFFFLGADVTCTDGRPEHLEWIQNQFPSIETRTIDLEKPYPELSKFDVVLHFGVLYHLSDPIKHLKEFLVKQEFDHLFLETEVSNYPDASFVLRIAESGYDQGISKVGGRPTSRAIEKVLTESGLAWERHDTAELNSIPHDYSWQEKNTPETYRIGLRRFYHIQK